MIDFPFLIAHVCKFGNLKNQSVGFIECFLIALNCALLRSYCAYSSICLKGG